MVYISLFWNSFEQVDYICVSQSAADSGCLRESRWIVQPTVRQSAFSCSMWGWGASETLAGIEHSSRNIVRRSWLEAKCYRRGSIIRRWCIAIRDIYRFNLNHSVMGKNQLSFILSSEWMNWFRYWLIDPVCYTRLGSRYWRRENAIRFESVHTWMQRHPRPQSTTSSLCCQFERAAISRQFGPQSPTFIRLATYYNRRDFMSIYNSTYEFVPCAVQHCILKKKEIEMRHPCKFFLSEKYLLTEPYRNEKWEMRNEKWERRK